MDDLIDSPFRARSNTWPLPRSDLLGDENEDNEANDREDPILLSANNNNHLMVIPTTAHEVVSLSKSQQLQSHLKKNTSRRNAWGNMSYADLITQAIQGSPDKRLTLSQIYEWMVQNVPYFKDKGDSNSSAGWKNSIRHNLSLHNRFMRVQNEGTGKSSWWMINPDAKPGKAARRRATSMETQKFEKKRGRVKRKVDAMRNGVILESHSLSSSSLCENDQDDQTDQNDSISPGGVDHSVSPCGRLSPISDNGPSLSPLPHWNSDIFLNDGHSIYSDINEPYHTMVELANTMKIGGNGTKTSGPTASQVMGHLLSLSSSLPNDLDLDSLQGGLECDVNSVIQHELNVDGNLDFNFDAPTTAANPASSIHHSWVH